MSSSNFPPRDQAFNNLAVPGTSALNVAKINQLIVGNFPPSEIIPISPSANFVLGNNNSKRIGNIVQISFNGVVTGDVGNLPVNVGNLPQNVLPSNNVFGISCQMPSGIVLTSIDSNGLIQTCPSGYPFPVGSYNININTTYFI